jgi:hypothetical protein
MTTASSGDCRFWCNNLELSMGKNELIQSDVIVPESDLQTMLALDKTSQACARQLVEAGANEAVKALVIARSIKQFRGLLSDAVMSDIMELQGSPLGFKTDKAKDGGYSLHVVRDCVIQAFMRGLRVTGNEINIIAGNLYVTKEGFERLLAELHGLTNLKIQIGVPHTGEGGALVPARAEWKFQAMSDSITWEKEETADYRIPVRVNAAMGIDAIKGKARSKVLREVYARVTGSRLAVEDDAVDSEVLVDVGQ